MAGTLWMSKQNLILTLLELVSNFRVIGIPDTEPKLPRLRKFDEFFELMLPVVEDDAVLAFFDEVKDEFVPLSCNARVRAIIGVNRPRCGL